ncbi:hypothetical protein [Burkholderia ubonensis]|uniref:hypothetical protein n=1 Tax=Burkholderia ubonensis TaxID=101571 RepID=UPI000759BD6D|nr:hypothetical protein [Burkholderia ubonensis]KVP17133.1 hypothetical protein WJ84_02315 [Burkholderia ubonensis]KVP39746.1 hypothetical protein WJ87_06065 [Burkholderia ubonensis]
MNKKIKTIAIASAALFALPAFADEADTFCQLNQAQSDVQRSIAGSAEVFSSVGDPVTGSSSVVTVGVRKSLSKHYQANLMGKLADAQCTSYRAARKLAEQAQNVEQRSNLKAFDAMEPLLRQALAAANENVKKEQDLLAARAARLADVKDAFETADSLRTQLASLAQIRSRQQDQLPAAEVPLKDLVAESVSDQADVAALTSKIQAQAGWEVTVAAGTRTDLRGNAGASNFIAVTATWNFGQPAASRAAGKVASLTTQLLNEQRDAGMQSLARARDTVHGLIDSEKLVLDGLQQRKLMVDSTIARLAGLDTEDGLRAMRAAKVEQLTAAAKIAGSEARLDYLKGWLARNLDSSN